jgi:glycerophosphoryl diester phosphodiesterase
MADYSALKATIDASINTNGQQAITGAILNDVLNEMVDVLGEGYTFLGMATPTTNPTTPEGKAYYLAGAAGTYRDFGNIVVNDDEVALLVWNGTAWSKVVSPAASKSVVSQLGQRLWHNGFVGDNNEYVHQDLSNVIAGRTYLIRMVNPTWDITGVTLGSGYSKFNIIALDENYNETLLSSTAIDGSVLDSYRVTLPNNTTLLRIGGRATMGTEVNFVLTDVTGEDEKSFYNSAAMSIPGRTNNEANADQMDVHSYGIELCSSEKIYILTYLPYQSNKVVAFWDKDYNIIRSITRKELSLNADGLVEDIVDTKGAAYVTIAYYTTNAPAVVTDKWYYKCALITYKSSNSVVGVPLLKGYHFDINGAVVYSANYKETIGLTGYLKLSGLRGNVMTTARGTDRAYAVAYDHNFNYLGELTHTNNGSIIACNLSYLSETLNNNGITGAEYVRLAIRANLYELNVVPIPLSALSDGQQQMINTYGKIMSKSLSHFRCVAHRGQADGTCPENTAIAFKRAAQKGFLDVETDIRYTSDGVAVLLHDEAINRTARNADGTSISSTIAISDITYAEALTYDFGIYAGAEYAGTKIMTFENYIILCRNLGLRPNIELKVAANVDGLLDIVQQHRMLSECFWITSNENAIATITNRYPKSRIIVLAASPISAETITLAQNVKTPNNEVIVSLYPKNYSADDVSLCREAQLPLEISPVNSFAELLAIDTYISGVTSDSTNLVDILYKKELFTPITD